MRPPPPLPSPRLKNPPRFAVKVVEHAQTYWRLLARVNPRDLRLTSIDDEIYNDLMETFPELSQEPYEKLAKIDEDWMKNADMKKRWRDFMEEYKETVKDYNFGSLIRTDASDEYGEKNTIFGKLLLPWYRNALSHVLHSSSHAGKIPF